MRPTPERPLCHHCRREITRAGLAPDIPAVCCDAESCMRAELAYGADLRALEQGKRPRRKRQVEVVEDARLT